MDNTEIGKRIVSGMRAGLKGFAVSRGCQAARASVAALVCFFVLIFGTGCGRKEQEEDIWLKNADLSADETKEELYEKAKKEDVLIIYTVSTRVTKVKEAFEKEYPGLFVEVRDLRSPDLIEAVKANYESGKSECDVVLCNDNSGAFKETLVDTGIVVPYLPADIAAHMKEGVKEGIVSFVYETQMLFYNADRYESCPVDNLWALTDPRYKGKIYMPNPLRSFSTYAFCTAAFAHCEELEAAYRDYAGKELEIPEGYDAAMVFWEKISKNIVFTNSSDEVVEALVNQSADFGIMVSSKMRLQDVGYHLQPVYRLKPFTGCRTSFAVMIARNSNNINTAKLFIRFLLGEADGTGEGYKPFNLLGTWSAREDVEDGTPVGLEKIDLIVPDTDELIRRKNEMEKFWAEILKESAMVQE